MNTTFSQNIPKLTAPSVKNEKHTPAHAPGFADRLKVIFDRVGAKPREYATEISNSTALSRTGSKLLIEEDRPPKQLKAFNSLVKHLLHLLEERKIVIDKDKLADFLLTGSSDPFLVAEKNNHSLGEFTDLDPVLTSKIILKVEDTANKLQINKNGEIPKNDLDLIYYRILSYCFKNNITDDFDRIEKQIESLLILAKDKLL